MTPDEYREYLASPHWHYTRRVALERAGHRCQACGTTHKLHVHHRSYQHLGDEHDDDLRVLCRTCHDRVHALPQPLPKATDYVTASELPNLDEPVPIGDALTNVVHFICVDYEISEAANRHPASGP